MIKKSMWGAIALACGGTGLSAQAATVSLGNWAYGSTWNQVTVGTPNHRGAAGGFRGGVVFTGTENGFSGLLQDFVTYCVEIEESFRLPSGVMDGYSVIAGASYGKWDNANGSGNSAGDTAVRLGQLLSYVGSTAGAVDSSAESTSMQLAIWNLIYDTDATVRAGAFRETSNGVYNDYADTLLAAAADWTQMHDVYVLSKSGKQDFVLARQTQQRVPASFLQNQVPEPASLALAALALGAAGIATRRRMTRR